MTAALRTAAGALARAARGESRARRGAWIAVAAVLTLTPAVINAARQSRYRSSIIMFPSRQSALPAPRSPVFLRGLLRDRELRSAVRNQFGLRKTGRLSGVTVTPVTIPVGLQRRRTRVLRLVAEGSTPARAKQLTDFLAIQAIGASARPVALRARRETLTINRRLRSSSVGAVERKALESRRAALPVTIQGVGRFVLGRRATKPRITRQADRIIDSLPGSFPPRRSPVVSAAAGLLLALVLWLVALTVPRWAPRK